MSDGQLAYTELQRQITKHQGEWAMFSWYPKCWSISMNMILNSAPDGVQAQKEGILI